MLGRVALDWRRARLICAQARGEGRPGSVEDPGPAAGDGEENEGGLPAASHQRHIAVWEDCHRAECSACCAVAVDVLKRGVPGEGADHPGDRGSWRPHRALRCLGR
eukprot:1708851-Lingulodinium_polyedra.AAC.1